MIPAVIQAVCANSFWAVTPAVEMMKAPGAAAGTYIMRALFEANPKLYFYLLRTFGGGVAGFLFGRLPGFLIRVVCFPLCFAFGGFPILADFVFGGLPGFLIRVVCFPLRFVFGGFLILPGFFIPAVGLILRFAGGVAGFVFSSIILCLLACVVCYLLGLLMATYCASSPACTCSPDPAAASASGIVEYISSEPNFDVCYLWCLVKCAFAM